MVQYSHIGLDEGPQMSGGMYGSGGGGHRSNSSASSSPPATNGSGNNNNNNGLVVPQPIKGGQGNGGGQAGGGGSGRKYQCKMCPQSSNDPRPRVFGSKADLQLHTQIHMRESKPYKCSQCNKSFANSSYLSQHTRIHLGIKPYRCEICQRKFTQLSHLQQHIRTHTGDKPYRCRFQSCTKAFSQLSNLQSHSRCHQTDKPYKCNSCYKCFNDEAGLLDHIPKHKESKHLKTHICQYCGKSYTQETYLAKHMQKHSDRPDKRPTLPNQPSGQSGAGGGGGNGTGGGGGVVAATSLPSAADAAYWSKVDYGHAAASERDYQASLMDPRLNPVGHHGGIDPRHHLGEDLRQSAASVAMQVSTYGDSVKTSSAFSPIQGAGMLNTATGFSMAGSRNYFYDPLGSFPKHHSQMGFDSKSASAANSFPNQLISLSQIRQYAHQPSTDLLHSLKEKI